MEQYLIIIQVCVSSRLLQADFDDGNYQAAPSQSLHLVSILNSCILCQCMNY